MNQSQSQAKLTDSGDQLLSATPERPDVKTLAQEYQRAITLGPDTEARIADSEKTRYNLWNGQTADGVVHQEKQGKEKARPWNKCSDARTRLADNACNWLVDLGTSAFWSSRFQAEPHRSSTLTSAQSSELRTVMSWMVNGCLRGVLVDEVEFGMQVAATAGWMVLHPTWEQRRELRLRKVTLEELAGLAQGGGQRTEGLPAPSAQAGGEQAAVFAEVLAMVLDPAREAEAAQALQAFFPHLRKARARQVVREVRTTGEAEFPVAVDAGNEPALCVLVPGLDVFLPPESVAPIQRAPRAVFRRVWLTEADLRARGAVEGWDEAFVEAASGTAGKSSALTGAAGGYLTTLPTTLGNRQVSTPQVGMDKQNLVELVYAYVRQVDADGVPGIWLTVFSPHLGEEEYALHELVDYAHGEYPFIAFRLETTGRKPGDSRSVPEVLGTDQADAKRHRDAVTNLAQLTTLPMFRRRTARASAAAPEFGPGAIMNDPTGSLEAITLPNGNPQISLELFAHIQSEADQYFGRNRVDTHAGPAQLRQQRLVNRWLLSWSQAFWQLTVLAYQYLGPTGELEEILGRAPQMTAEEVARHKFSLYFDVRSLDNEWLMKMLEAIERFILPADAGGTVDRAKLVQWALAYLSPTLAEEVTMDQQGAAQQVFSRVREEIAQMALGNEAIYTENDPTAGMKLQFAQQIIQANPQYQQSLAQNERFRLLLEKYLANLKQSQAQQENKTIGRLGVKPEGM